MRLRQCRPLRDRADGLYLPGQFCQGQPTEGHQSICLTQLSRSAPDSPWHHPVRDAGQARLHVCHFSRLIPHITLSCALRPATGRRLSRRTGAFFHAKPPEGKNDLDEPTQIVIFCGVPTGIRTPVHTVKGCCPRPLDDRDLSLVEVRGIEPRTSCMPCKRSPS